MISEMSKNSPNQALEEKLSNMHEQMAGVTSRLDRTEHELDRNCSVKPVIAQ